MIRLADARPLTDFVGHPGELIEQLRQTGEPQVLTDNGKPVAVVQDAEAYQKLLDLVDQAEALEGIRRGLASSDRGEGRPVEEVFTEVRAKYDIPTDA